MATDSKSVPQSKHTPGPWTVSRMDSPYHKGEGWYTIRDPRNCYVAELRELDAATYKDGQFGANARLIAAAPDLLRALQIIAGWSKCQCRERHGDNSHCCVLVAEAAIAQAEGQ